jgi:hypothetical protein
MQDNRELMEFNERAGRVYRRQRRHGDRSLRQSSGHGNRCARLHRPLRPVNDVVAILAPFADILKHNCL